LSHCFSANSEAFQNDGARPDLTRFDRRIAHVRLDAHSFTFRAIRARLRHAFVNIRSIMRLARKLKFLPEDPAEELKMPQTKEVKRPTMTAKQISDLINVIEDIHDLCLMSIALFCATRTSETLGLTWRSYNGTG